MKKRYVLKNKRRFVTMLILLVAVSVSAGLIVTAGADTELQSDGSNYRKIKIEKGDTLWEIAIKHGQNKDPRVYIHEIKKLNNLESSNIYAGQELLLP